MTDDLTADRLAAVAAELAVRVRDEQPDDNAEWLTRRLPEPGDWFRLAFVLAAAVPDDRSWRALTSWTVLGPSPEPVRLQPCGTAAAARRHRYHGEELCDPCREAENERDRDRKRTQRAQLRAA